MVTPWVRLVKGFVLHVDAGGPAGMASRGPAPSVAFFRGQCFNSPWSPGPSGLGTHRLEDVGDPGDDHEMMLERGERNYAETHLHADFGGCYDQHGRRSRAEPQQVRHLG